MSVAGLLHNTHPALAHCWHPVARSNEISDQPTRVVLLGAPLVLLAASAEQIAGLRMLRQEELRIVAQQHRALHRGQPRLPAVAGDTQFTPNRQLAPAHALLPLGAQRRECIDAELIRRLAVGDGFTYKVISENGFEANSAMLNFDHALSLQFHRLAARRDEFLLVCTGLCARRLRSGFHGRFLLRWAGCP